MLLYIQQSKIVGIITQRFLTITFIDLIRHFINNMFGILPHPYKFATVMKQVPLNRAYRSKLKDLYETLKDRTFTHTQFKSYLGVDWGIWTARAYCSQYGVMFDWSEKRWKRNKVYKRIEKKRDQWKLEN